MKIKFILGFAVVLYILGLASSQNYSIEQFEEASRNVCIEKKDTYGSTIFCSYVYEAKFLQDSSLVREHLFDLFSNR